MLKKPGMSSDFYLSLQIRSLFLNLRIFRGISYEKLLYTFFLLLFFLFLSSSLLSSLPFFLPYFRLMLFTYIFILPWLSLLYSLSVFLGSPFQIILPLFRSFSPLLGFIFPPWSVSEIFLPVHDLLLQTPAVWYHLIWSWLWKDASGGQNDSSGPRRKNLESLFCYRAWKDGDRSTGPGAAAWQPAMRSCFVIT